CAKYLLGRSCSQPHYSCFKQRSKVRASSKAPAWRSVTRIVVCYGRTTTRATDRTSTPLTCAAPTAARCSTRRRLGGEAIDFLDDSTFVLTSEAGRRRPGTIDTVSCGLSREQRPQ